MSIRFGRRSVASNLSISKRYIGKPFLYWWDVWDGRKQAIREEGELVLVQRDTGKKARIKAESLVPLLTERRRTSRGRSRGGRGNWGLYVRSAVMDEIEIAGGHEAPARLAVVWS